MPNQPTGSKAAINSTNLAALASSPDAPNKGTQQYLTPTDWAEALAVPLTHIRPVITDLHCGHGSLLHAAANDTTTHLLGHDIDTSAHIPKHPPGGQPQGSASPTQKLQRHTIHHDITQTFPLLLNTQTKFDLLTLNPPFSLRWKCEHLPTITEDLRTTVRPKGGRSASTYIDSTHATLRMANTLLTPRGEALVICNAAAYQRILVKHPQDLRHAWLTATIPSFFPGVSKNLQITAIYLAKWHDTTTHGTTTHGRAGCPQHAAPTPGCPQHAAPTPGCPQHAADYTLTPSTPADLTNELITLRQKHRPPHAGITDTMQRHPDTIRTFTAVKEEIKRLHHNAKSTPNITIDPAGNIRTRLTSYQRHAVSITKKEAAALTKINGTHPYQLVLQRDARLALQKLITSKTWTICPTAKRTIEAAIASYSNGRISLTPLSTTQCLGWIDDEDTILCTTDFQGFKAGNRYPIKTSTIEFLKKEKRPCIINGKRTTEEIEVTGNDLNIIIEAEHTCAAFMHIPDRNNLKIPCFDLATLQKHFHIPRVQDVAQAMPQQYQQHLTKLDTLLRPPYRFKGFQKEDIARAACTNGCIFGHVQGLGKSLAAFAYPALKNAKRTLIVAPGGLIKQFRETAANFYGKPLPVIRHIADIKKWKLHLPPKPNSQPQYFITTYEALTRNGGDEWQPERNADGEAIIKSNDRKRIIEYSTWATQTAIARLTGKTFDPAPAFESIGVTKNGITCLWKPTLASMLAIYEGQGAGFDCLVIDEATRLQSSTAKVACGIRKLNPTYRLLLTGTPIKNKVDSIFHLLHYAAGGHPSPTIQFPFTADSESKERFANLYLEKDRFITREIHKKHLAKQLGKKTPNSKIIKRSSRICNIHHLWKLIAPTIIRRRKDNCGEDIVERTFRPIVVKPGTAQNSCYGHHLKHRPVSPKGDPTSRLKSRTAIGVQINILRQVALCPDDPDLANIINGSHQNLKRSWSPWTPKLSATLSLVTKLLAQGEQVVIGSPFRHFNQTIHQLLTQAKVPSLLLDGQTTPAQRGLLVNQFKNKTIPVIIAGVKAMGEGYSLECCSHLILPSLSWAYDENDQFIDRVWRLNSAKPVTIYPIITECTIDELMHSTFADKKDSAQLALDARILPDQVDDINPEILLADAYDKFRASTDTIPEQTLEDGWPQLRKSLTVSARLYFEFHPPITHHQVTPEDIASTRNALTASPNPQQDFAIAQARNKAKLLAKIKKQQRRRRQ